MSEPKGPVKEHALVLKSIRHGESSRIVTLFGQVHGKFAVISKGARKGRAGAALGMVEAPGRIEALVYFKQTRSVQILGQVSLLDGYRRIKSDLALMGFASVILQYMNRAFIDDEPNERAFESALEALSGLNTGNINPRLLLWLFQIKLTETAGFGIDPFCCHVCGKADIEIKRHNPLSLDNGAFSCQNCTPVENRSLSVSGESVAILRHLTKMGTAGLKNLRIGAHAETELTITLHRFLKHHHPSVGDLTALDMLDVLENSN